VAGRLERGAARLFHRMYDRAVDKMEKAGLSDRRGALLADARGSVVDIGAGTGLNLEHYPAALERLVLVEPAEEMAVQLERKLAAGTRSGELVRAGAEQLPFADDSFDTAVFTLVLCTVPDPAAALAEARRILKPGGRLLFIEHVRGEDGLARWQDRLERPWRFIAAGCRCNRDTASAIEASGFRIERIEKGTMAKAAPLVRPLIAGVARA